MNKRIIEIGFSPCPNDTFIFEALVHQHIDTGNMMFKPILEDVETLNQWALEGRLPISKLSYGVLPLVADTYNLLRSGGALGKGVGPLLVSAFEALPDMENAVVAIPGEHTTAHFLFTHAYPTVKNKVFMRYDHIESFVLSGKGLGVIIHESRFTYAQKGLHCISDLGEVWERKTGLPIPLGGIAIKKSIPVEVQRAINDCIKRSILYAKERLPELSEMVRVHAQEMEESVMRKHIDLYVNHFSEDLNVEGEKAVRLFEETAAKMGNTAKHSIQIEG